MNTIRYIFIAIVIALLSTIVFALSGHAQSYSAKTVSINGRVCVDINFNNQCDSTDPGKPDVMVRALPGLPSGEEKNDITDAEGKYQIGGLINGNTYNLVVQKEVPSDQVLASVVGVVAPHNACDVVLKANMVFLPIVSR